MIGVNLTFSLLNDIREMVFQVLISIKFDCKTDLFIFSLLRKTFENEKYFIIYSTSLFLQNTFVVIPD